MENKLQRDRQGKRIAGVCAGLSEYFDVDVTLVRVAFLVAAFAGFSGVLAYIIFWIVMPVKPLTYHSAPDAKYWAQEEYKP